MNRIYNKPFKVGFAATIIFGILLNVVSFQIARDKYLELAEGNLFLAGKSSFNWGFPFDWFGYSSYFFEDGFVGFVLNFISIVSCAFAAGLLVRYIMRRRVSEKNI